LQLTTTINVCAVKPISVLATNINSQTKN